VAKLDSRVAPAYSIAQAAHYLKIPAPIVRSWVLGRNYPRQSGKGCGHCRSVAQSLSDRPRPRNLTILAAAVSSGGKGVFSHPCPAATRAQYPRSGVGIVARRHALERPTSDMPNRFDRVRVDSDQTSLYSASRVKVQSGLRLSGRFAEGMGACSSVFEDIAVTRDANSTTFLPCLSSALCRSFV